MDLYLNILKRYWGFTAFRPLQAAIIQSVCDGKDTLGLMPTGGGKSITFQVPAMAMSGICLVVTPLIALMRDQVERLKQIGIAATAVHSELSREEIVSELNKCIARKYKFLYLSPERLENTLFLEKLQAVHVCLLVVDESHCISQWGYDFRPAYLRIASLRQRFPDVPVLALTATATPDVADDIQNRLLFRKKNVLQHSFFRPNLAYTIQPTENKRGSLLHLLNRIPGTAIVYTRNREQTQETALFLQRNDIVAESFHAGLKREEKIARQSRWKTGACRVMVATNAFGMGIDKPDVRLVVHLDMPNSLEEYFQEAGRAGRDGEKAYAIALCSKTESHQLRKQLHEAFPDKKQLKLVYEALGDYYHIAEGSGEGQTWDFQLEAFCEAYSFSPRQVHYALKLLVLSGYLIYQEEEKGAYKIRPQITFLTNRVNRRVLWIPPAVYEERYERAQRRTQRVIDYISSRHICRSQLLLNYFGEKETPTCGCCDICRSKHPSGLTNHIFNEIRTRLENELLPASPSPIRELTLRLPYPAETSIAVVRFLLDNDERFQLQDGALLFHG